MKRIAVGILAASVMTTAHADPMYVSDKLVVNVYAEADQESSKVTTLDSGDAVEAIEKVETFTHVRLPDSREGWIKSSYLSSQVPAIVRLKELEKEHGVSASAPNTQLADELKQAKEQNATLRGELAAAKAATAQARAPVSAVATPAPQGRLEAEQTERDPASLGLLHSFAWGAGFALFGGVIGFALGYQALARRIRRKYGSVKIY
jgi:hypothetical protein